MMAMALAGIASLVFLFCMASMASACSIPDTFRIERIDLAEVIFRGRIEAYEKLPDSSSMASLTFAVDETYKGLHKSPSWDAIWHENTYGVPEDLSEFVESYGDEFVVGLVNPAAALEIASSGTYTPEEIPEHLNRSWILSWPCSAPFMFVIIPLTYVHVWRRTRSRDVDIVRGQGRSICKNGGGSPATRNPLVIIWALVWYWP